MFTLAVCFIFLSLINSAIFITLCMLDKAYLLEASDKKLKASLITAGSSLIIGIVFLFASLIIHITFPSSI